MGLKADVQAKEIATQSAEIWGLQKHVRKLNIALDTAWNRNDELLGQLAGSQLMPDGRRASDHAREMILRNDGDDTTAGKEDTTG